MKTIKEFISKQVNESLNNDKIEYIVSEYASGDEVIEPCEALADVESFIYNAWNEKEAQEIMKGVEEIKPNEFFFWKNGQKEFVLVTRMK